MSTPGKEIGRREFVRTSGSLGALAPMPSDLTGLRMARHVGGLPPLHPHAAA